MTLPLLAIYYPRQFYYHRRSRGSGTALDDDEGKNSACGRVGFSFKCQFTLQAHFLVKAVITTTSKPATTVLNVFAIELVSRNAAAVSVFDGGAAREATYQAACGNLLGAERCWLGEFPKDEAVIVFELICLRVRKRC